MIRNIFLSCLILLALFSCKNNKSESNDSTALNNQTQIDIQPDSNEKGGEPIVTKVNINEQRAIAKEDIREFLKTENKPPIFLTSNYHLVDYISDGIGGPKDMIDVGEWYNFLNDNTYSHGFFDKIEDSGKFVYDQESKKVIMLPVIETKSPSEWRVLNSGDIIVLVGTAKFRNNPFQKHLKEIKDQPQLDNKQ